MEDLEFAQARVARCKHNLAVKETEGVYIFDAGRTGESARVWLLTP